MIQKYIVKRGKRNVVRGLFHSKSDDERLVTAWRSDFDKIRRVLDVRSFIFDLAVVNFLFC